MTLKDNFYHIKHSEQENDQHFSVHISLNRGHFIYGAHFPNRPITPGVCLLQIAKELLEEHKEENLLLAGIVNVKYLAVINPDEHAEIHFSFSKLTTTTDGYKVNVLISGNDGTSFAKLSLLFRHEPALDRMMQARRICVLIPTYNHAPFLDDLLQDLLRQTSHIIIVDDGSMDDTPNILARYSGRLTIITHTRNMGKGRALQNGMSKAVKMGYGNVITMDSDGQHKSSDLRAFIDAANTHPRAMLIGSRSFHEEYMPAGNKFANRLSNFWFAIQSGRHLPDTQCGYRLYPMEEMQKLRLFTSRYEAELEWLLRLAWRNIPLIPIPVHVSYMPKGQRVSHYKTSTDFFRISLLNAIMFFAAIFYGYPSMLLRCIFRRIFRR
jgi:3-hydroxymyristoyl/3-hydroxydecanoyl-(acyl carrier protein) dehydratase